MLDWIHAEGSINEALHDRINNTNEFSLLGRASIKIAYCADVSRYNPIVVHPRVPLWFSYAPSTMCCHEQ
ncbi:hypothetical protein [Mesorhizobium sp.]|uniref:hypothetical protein n=1 Tax=Mesorhizobium sp. TaxID=1871066 RepID=UPI00262E602D|nr:hypothetical protein [Mesorhizobium sp.]